MDIRTNIKKYYDPITMPGGYPHSLPETLRMVDLYYNSQFKTGSLDEQGFRKFFYNIVKPACDIATKFVDLDTNNITLQPQGSPDELKVWFMERRLRSWLREHNIASLLNDIGFHFPKYGSVVIKKVKGNEWKIVNLQNLRLDPAAESLKRSPFVYELQIMTATEVEEMDWDEDKKEELISRSTDGLCYVYVCYEKTVKGWTKKVLGEPFVNKKSDRRATETFSGDRDDFLPAIELSEKDVTSLPYRELHWEKIPGRWLGYGFVEYLEENQIATNEAENLERAGLKYTSLKLWQTRDETVAGQNMLSGTSNGEIIKVESEITPIDMAERNLGAFNNTRGNWKENTERKTFTTDITTGANLPSRTPLGVANLQASLATSYFELKRENFGIFLKMWIENDIMPDFLIGQEKEHQLIFQASDKDIDKIDQMITDLLVDERVVAYAKKTGFFPPQMERELYTERVRGSLKKKKNRFLKVPASFYKNARYFVGVEVTGEGLDVGARGSAIQMALQIIGTNPGIMQNPVTKNLFFQFLSLGGISPAEIDALQEAATTSNQAQAPAQVAGSLARPQTSQIGQTAGSVV